MMRRLPTLFVLFFVATLSVAAVDLSQTIAELRLKDGRILKAARVVGYSPTNVALRYEGGLCSVPYAQLPDDVRTAAESRRPPPPDPEKQAAIEAEIRARVARLAEVQRRERERIARDAAEFQAREAERQKLARRQEEIERAIGEKTIVVGMTQEQVVRSWGEPTKKTTDTSGSGDEERWTYSGRKWVSFKSGVVSSWSGANGQEEQQQNGQRRGSGGGSRGSRG